MMSGKRAFLELLKQEGVEVMFGNPGTTELPLMDAFATETDIRYVLGLQEAAVMSMADGYAQASGRLAVANSAERKRIAYRPPPRCATTQASRKCTGAPPRLPSTMSNRSPRPLTEMFSPGIIADRVRGMLAGYPFITEDTLAYFTPRLTQAPRDVDFALGYVKEHADTPEKQALVLDTLRFKCDVLWAQLDALHHAYVTPGLIPPGAFRPEGM